MAIFSIKGNKRMGIDASNHEISAIQYNEKLPYGWVNDKNLLCLTHDDV